MLLCFPLQHKIKRQHVQNVLRRLGGLNATAPPVNTLIGVEKKEDSTEENLYFYRSKITPHYNFYESGSFPAVGFNDIRSPNKVSRKPSRDTSAVSLSTERYSQATLTSRSLNTLPRPSHGLVVRCTYTEQAPLRSRVLRRLERFAVRLTATPTADFLKSVFVICLGKCSSTRSPNRAYKCSGYLRYRREILQLLQQCQSESSSGSYGRSKGLAIHAGRVEPSTL